MKIKEIKKNVKKINKRGQISIILILVIIIIFSLITLFFSYSVKKDIIDKNTEKKILLKSCVDNGMKKIIEKIKNGDYNKNNYFMIKNNNNKIESHNGRIIYFDFGKINLNPLCNKTINKPYSLFDCQSYGKDNWQDKIITDLKKDVNLCYKTEVNDLKVIFLDKKIKVISQLNNFKDIYDIPLMDSYNLIKEFLIRLSSFNINKEDFENNKCYYIKNEIKKIKNKGYQINILNRRNDGTIKELSLIAPNGFKIKFFIEYSDYYTITENNNIIILNKGCENSNDCFNITKCLINNI